MGEILSEASEHEGGQPAKCLPKKTISGTSSHSVDISAKYLNFICSNQMQEKKRKEKSEKAV